MASQQQQQQQQEQQQEQQQLQQQQQPPPPYPDGADIEVSAALAKDVSERIAAFCRRELPGAERPDVDEEPAVARLIAYIGTDASKLRAIFVPCDTFKAHWLGFLCFYYRYVITVHMRAARIGEDRYQRIVMLRFECPADHETEEQSAAADAAFVTEAVRKRARCEELPVDAAVATAATAVPSL